MGNNCADMNAPHGLKVLPKDQFSSFQLLVGTFAASTAASWRELMKAAASSATRRSSSALQPVFAWNFRASRLYQVSGPSSYELSLAPEASDIQLDDNRTSVNGPM
jgi:hypothetical protein